LSSGCIRVAPAAGFASPSQGQVGNGLAAVMASSIIHLDREARAMPLTPEQLAERKAHAVFLRGFSLLFLLLGAILLAAGGQWQGLILLAVGAIMALAWLPTFTRPGA
jgi:hypothetical protein